MMTTEEVTRLSFPQRILIFIGKLNLYNHEESLSLVDQILASRIYITLFTISVFILLLFTSLSLQTRVVTVSSPSLITFERLSTRYPSTISCPCSQMTNPYGKFVKFNPEYHQVCSSGFIDDKWISSLFNINTINYHPLDYRLIASSQFQVLSSLCQVAKQSVSDALNQFALIQMISKETLFRTAFETEISAQINQLKATTISDVNRIDQLISLFIVGNGLKSALRSNFLMTGVPGSNIYNSYSSIYPNHLYLNKNSSIPIESDENCLCKNTFNCTFPSGFYEGFHPIIPGKSFLFDQSPVFIIPGMKVGCTPKHSILQSTLQCFFDQKCLDILIYFTGVVTAPPPLKNLTDNPSRFNRNTTLDLIFNELMIESLHNKIRFDDYYVACAPQICTYSYVQQFSFIYIVTTIISLVGGLSTIIGIISPIFVQFIIRKIPRSLLKRRQSTTSTNIPKLNLQEHIIHLFIVIRQKIMKFNLFKKKLVDIQHGIYSTRLYILLLILGVVILTIYSSMIFQTFTVKINNPTLKEYKDLYKRYSTKLTCPCRNLSINSSSIMNISPRYHQICSSVFVRNEDWLKYWSMNRSDPNMTMSHFRLSGLSFFSTLKFICDFSSTTLTNELKIFNSTQIITTQVLRPDVFDNLTSFSIGNVQWRAINSLKNLFMFIETIIENNQMIIHELNNVKPVLMFVDGLWLLRYTSREYQYEKISCSCEIIFGSNCYLPQEFYCQSLNCHEFESLSNLLIPGFVVGCFPLQSFMYSTLECFYNETCIQLLIDCRFSDNFDIKSSIDLMNITALDLNQSSSLSPTMWIEEIFLGGLFVDEWITDANYTNYYDQCNPYVCTYTYTERKDLIYVITCVAGLLGGLTIILRLLVPSSVKLFIWIYHYLYDRRLRENDDHQSDLFHSFIIFVRRNLVTLNIYEAKKATHVNSVVATRIYVVLLIFSIVVVSIFTGLEQQTLTFSVEYPNETQFNYLNRQYSSRVSCPCSQNTMLYNQFIEVQHVLHEICVYPLISSQSLSYYMYIKGDIWMNSDLLVLSAQLYLLSKMCEKVESSLFVSQIDLETSKFVSIEIYSRKTFEDEINSIFKIFFQKLRDQFNRQMNFVLDTLRSNQFQDRYMSNWKTEFSNQTENNVLRLIPLFFNNNSCTCTNTMSNCSRPLIFKDSNNNSISLTGFIGGCSIIDGLRQSTLQCFFNRICLDELATLLNLPFSIPELNSSVPTRFPPNTTSIGSIIDELFIESWNQLSNYSAYFDFCAPSKCEYSYVERNNIVYIITTLLGMYGGLTVGLKLIIWYSFYLISMVVDYHRRRRKVTTSSTIELY